jgi:hypothetical protein
MCIEIRTFCLENLSIPVENILNFAKKFWWAFWPSLLAVILALVFDKKRLPNIAVCLEKKIVVNPHSVNDGRPVGVSFYSWRFIVTNLEMPWYLRLLSRQVAQNCSATLEFINSEGEKMFIMKGRWANTPEISHIPKDSQIERTLFPDPISIFPGKSEPLDCIVQRKNDKYAYGCNNEAYFHDWKTPQYKLSPGQYVVKIRIITQNGVPLVEEFSLEVNADFELTQIISQKRKI